MLQIEAKRVCFIMKQKIVILLKKFFTKLTNFAILQCRDFRTG